MEYNIGHTTTGTYFNNDLFVNMYRGTFSRITEASLPKIEKVIFNDPATIVFWDDSTKTIVKAQDEKFDKEKGLAMAICKKFLGTNNSKSNFNKVFKKWCN